MSRTIISLSGEISKYHLNRFWSGFIELQYSLSENDNPVFIWHATNSDFLELISNVYQPKECRFLDDTVTKSYASYKENNKETSSRVDNYVKKVFSNLRSLELAINYAESNDSLIITMPVLLSQDSQGSNQLISYNSLPKEYLYIRYNSDIDTGYPLDNLAGTKDQLQHVLKFGEYLTGFIKSNYGKKIDDWPFFPKANFDYLGRNISLFSTWLLRTKFVPFLYRVFPFAERRVFGIEYRLRKYSERPIFTSENSVDVSCGNHGSLGIVGEHEIDIGCALKSYLNHGDERQYVRFLEPRDFNYPKKGLVINALDFCCIVFHESDNKGSLELALSQASKHLPKACSKIYVITNLFSKDELSELIASINTSLIEIVCLDAVYKTEYRLRDILFEIGKSHRFAYVFDDKKIILQALDGIVLNAMLHWMNNNSSSYISFSDNENYLKETVETDFPHIRRCERPLSLLGSFGVMHIDRFIEQYDFDDDETIGFYTYVSSFEECFGSLVSKDFPQLGRVSPERFESIKNELNSIIYTEELKGNLE
ncbi:hypothetical protein [Corallincola spongiicola]|uniref:Uncharacterized protein n=1 Tax=Corallincola spongiicola TaxID=2520508 RepID=A0ABY1WK71_9GAMM|nr:hypothetical protein [Corallincola spongiicola]TAA39589.1 hypothetical protein EXY25_18595 [Corallincola spongiicola]